MTDNFLKLKKKILCAAIIKSVVIGVSAGLFVAGTVLLALALGEVSIHWGFYVLMGVAVAAVSGGVSFLLMRPTDMKIAKKYDNKYNLNEKLQTMVAFAGHEGGIFALQREDAALALAGAGVRTITAGLICKYCATAALSCAMLFSGVFISANAQKDESIPPDDIGTKPPIGVVEPDPEDVFEYDLFMQSAMGELINNVRDSSLAKTEKDAVIAALEVLDADLTEIDNKNDMQTAVVSAVAVIDGVIYNANTFRPISEAIGEFDKDIAKSMRASVAVYNSSTVPLTEMYRVKAFELKIGGLIEVALEEPLANSLVSLKAPKNEDEEGETEEVLKFADVFPPYVQSLEEYLLEADKDDRIIASLETFKNALNKTLTRLNNNDYYKEFPDALFTEIDSAYSAFSINLNAALCVQCYNCVMNSFVRQRLAAIFQVPVAELPAFNEDLAGEGSPGNNGNNGNNDDDNTGDDDPGGSGGGNGKYDFVYGSDDIIYDPDRAEYVSYGDQVLDKNFAKVKNKIINGEIPEDLAKILETYYEILYNGIKDETVEE